MTKVIPSIPYNPAANPATEQERRLNSAHTRTWVTVERCFGSLKGRWLCLGPAGGNAAVYPEKVCNIILACAVLHNIALDNGAFDVPAQPDEPMAREPWPAQPPRGLYGGDRTSFIASKM